jgi:hypothetical protein
VEENGDDADEEEEEEEVKLYNGYPNATSTRLQYKICA